MEMETNTNTAETQWYYIQDGRRMGPVTRNSLLYHFNHQSLPPDTLVWNPELPDWQPAGQTSLAGEIPALRTPTPPPGIYHLRRAVQPEQHGNVRFYYVESSREKGPVSYKKLHNLLVENIIPSHTMIRRSGEADWHYAQDVFAITDKILPEPPELPPFWAAKTREAPDFKKIRVIWLILLTLVTLGLYQPIWFIIRRKAINSLQSSVKLRLPLLIAALVISIISTFANLALGVFEGLAEDFQRLAFRDIAELLTSLTDWIDLILLVIFIILTFTVRRVLKDHYNKHLGQRVAFSWLATLIFQFYYLQYKINRLV